MNPEVVVPLVAITMGSLMLLIPIAGLTARFALKPIVEAIARMKEMQAGGASPQEVHVLEQRIALLEQQYALLEGSVGRMTELKEFDKQLGAGR